MEENKVIKLSEIVSRETHAELVKFLVEKGAIPHPKKVNRKQPNKKDKENVI